MFNRIQDRLTASGFHQVRRVVVFVVGMTVLLLGITLIVLPGPAILVIPAGLAILGLEFRWARRLLRRARGVLKSGHTRFFNRNKAAASPTKTSLPLDESQEPVTICRRTPVAK
jgi:uncharacterized protein (TIGR02611 family)